MNKTKSTSLKHQQSLEEALGFTEDDLIANQHGGLSDAQREKLTQNHRTYLWSLDAWYSYVMTFAVFACGVIFILATTIFPIWVIISAFALRILLRYLGKYYAFGRDLREGKVQRIEGPIQIQPATSEGNRGYQIQIGQRSFFFYKSDVLIFKNGDPYAIYYLRTSSTFLSAEWLHAAQPFYEDSDGQK